MKPYRSLALLVLPALLPLSGFSRSAVFTYQGAISRAGTPADGNFDLRFQLYDSPTGISPSTPALTNFAVAVTNGLFVTDLDFGQVFNGSNFWLEVGIRAVEDAGPFTTLAPRQRLASTPYALFAFSAGSVGAGSIDNTALSPNAVASPNLQAAAVTADKIAPGTVVRSWNGLRDDIALEVAANMKLTTNGNSVRVEISTNAADYLAWSLHGNRDTSALLNFLGTADNQPLVLGVNNRPALRISPSDTGANLIGGAVGNHIGPSQTGNVIAGGGNDVTGETNAIAADFSVIAGGSANSAQADYAVVDGGQNNTVNPLADHGAIGGGHANRIGTRANYASIQGGWMNAIDSLSDDIFTFFGSSATISGGAFNSIGSNAVQTTIAGGIFNIVAAAASSVVVSGGQGNTVGENAVASTIGGGSFNAVAPEASHAVIPGGANNLAGGSYTFAAGRRARAHHQGTFVWADSANSDFDSTGANQFIVRAEGGVGIGTNAPAHPLHLASGAHVTAGGTWADASDATLKENFVAIEPLQVLETLLALPLSNWNYKCEGPQVKHLGPVAQDFHRLFGLGQDNRSITAVDRTGVAFAAIQGLSVIVKDQAAEIGQLRNDVAELRRLIRTSARAEASEETK